MLLLTNDECVAEHWRSQWHTAFRIQTSVFRLPRSAFSWYAGDMSHAAAPNLRWYHLTPGRVVVALLVIEGLLWLSERLQWFPFNHHKGWTVLIGMAAIVLAFVFLSLWLLAALLFRLRFQFSIRSLLLLTVVVAIPCSWLAKEREQARKQQAAVEAIKKLAGEVNYDYEFDASWSPINGAQPPGPTWLRRLLGDDFFANVVEVMLMERAVTDADLEQLEELTRLQALDLGETKVTDAGLEHLKGLCQLRVLGLEHTEVTDAGLEHLKGLSRLEVLNLAQTDVTDAGLEHLKGLSQLRTLDLIYTKVTDAGLEHLKQFSQLRELRLDATKLTDAGIEHLKGLSQLQGLCLHGGETTDASLEPLKGFNRLQSLDLMFTEVTDAGLEHLKGLSQLQKLWLNDTNVTDEGVKKLQQALPNCVIVY